jgi:multimeric flavodoxin WrbA
MKVLMVNGSPNKEGCTYTALTEMAKVYEAQKVEVEIIQLGKTPIRDCIACGKCRELDNACVFDDDQVNEFLEKAKDADGIVFGTPVYYAHPSGRILSFLDRAFYAGSKSLADKPGAMIASARRAGTTASMDVINKYFTIANMPIVSSSYWNGVHGNTPEEVRQDLEGLQTVKNIAVNMTWLMQCIAVGRQQGISNPQRYTGNRTNFIR